MGDLVGGRAAVLLDIDEAAALRLLTRSVEALPPTAVVPCLQVGCTACIQGCTACLQGATDAAADPADLTSAEL